MKKVFCVDEQLIPFKEKSSMKQYIPTKPHKWGYKFFILYDNDGIMYNTLPYTGKIEAEKGILDISPSSNAVLKLIKIAPRNKNFIVVFNNWFTSLDLVIQLKHLGILSLGTVCITD